MLPSLTSSSQISSLSFFLGTLQSSSSSCRTHKKTHTFLTRSMAKLLSFLLVFSVFFVSTITGLRTKEDPELPQCLHLCKQQQIFTESERLECQERCRQYIKEKEKRRGEGCAGGTVDEEEDENPYVFGDKHFTTVVKNQNGEFKLLQEFKHKLLSGVQNFRLAALIANPRAFVLPSHIDADIIIFVAKGKGSISLLRSERRESFNLKDGDILRIPSGTTIYLINRDKNKKLVIIKLAHSVFTPSRAVPFFGAGKESFTRTFSTELLEAAFKTKSDKLEKMFGGEQEVIIQASEEQIRALSHHDEGGIWPFSESKGTINLFEQKPIQSNDYGELREVSPEDYRQLEDVNIGLAFINITKGGMETAFYNSKSIKVVLVTKGEGYFEMACPHLSSSSSSSRSIYQKVNAQLSHGTVFIVPPGHPIITVASKNQNLEAVIFQINARGNKRFPLAGKKSIWKQIEKEAKELAFGLPAKFVDDIIGNQDREWFMKGPEQIPQQQQQEGRGYIRMKTE